MNNVTTYYRSSSIQGLFEVILVLLVLLVAGAPVGAAEPDKTPEDIQKKAVIIKYPTTKLFKQATADTGDEASFMQLYFVMKPEMNGRIPVSRSPNKTGDPDGWLDKDSFMEWNTVQMIQLEPQSGRRLAKVFNTQQCTSSFAREGQTSAGCEELGEEPSAWGNKKLENQKLLIPVFSKEQETFQGGFIRVFESGQAVTAASNAPSSSESKTQQTLGYDIVFAIDSTASMGQWFAPTTEVIQTFIKSIQQTTGSGEIKTALRMGVLFYRDRLIGNSPCSIEYLHKWGQELTGEIDSVVKALQNEREATCSSQEEPESVLDGLNRVIVDTKWRDNTFKAIILVGDASPHPATYEKNPMKLDVPTILKQSGEKSIRFLNIKLGEDDAAFKNLALATEPQNIGRYATVPKGEIAEFKSALLETLDKEWKILTTASQIQQDRQTGKIALSGGTSDCLSPDFLKKYRLTEYEALIICIRLPATADLSQALPAFLKGWVPEKIQGRLVASEFIFMDKSKLMIMTNILENIAVAALDGNKDGPDAFISTVQHALASQLSMQPSEIFKSGETLDGILKKANILPFKTTVLVFSAQEIQSWKAPDYQRLNTVLSEKVKYLRELSQSATALHMFGDKPHLYVPRAFFP
jgi:hypothetical protein